MKTEHEILDWVTLASILEYLEEEYGFEELWELLKINCFLNNPSMKSSLNFLRKTPWARKKIENLYVDTKMDEENQKA